MGSGGAGGSGGADGPSRKLLQNVRVIQRNLVYVIGLSLNICREDVLRRSEYFGRFGKILKISANRAAAGNVPGGSGNNAMPTGSAYVTFVRAEDAWKCISAIDGAAWDGRPVRACYGTTKYCNAFLKYQTCTNPECLYLHDVGDDADSYTKEELATGHLGAKAAALGPPGGAPGAAAAAAAAAAGAAGGAPGTVPPRAGMPPASMPYGVDPRSVGPGGAPACSGASANGAGAPQGAPSLLPPTARSWHPSAPPTPPEATTAAGLDWSAGMILFV